MRTDADLFVYRAASDIYNRHVRTPFFRGAFAMSSGAADLNLLFGIMAVQNDFVSRDALIEAMGTWVLDKSKTLGEILVERGALTSEHHALLTSLVAAHLRLHHDDPQQSLAS